MFHNLFFDFAAHFIIFVIPSNLMIGKPFDKKVRHMSHWDVSDEDYCEKYEQQIRDVGGVDLQILGIGSDGHIAFNEPGSSLGSRTRLKTLTSETVRDNARFFGSAERVPRLAITVGVGTILESRCCLLLAIGTSKAAAIRDAVEGPVTAQVTASALQLHREVIVVLDKAAASQLKRHDYYEDVEHVQHLLEAGDLKSLGIRSSSTDEP